MTWESTSNAAKRKAVAASGQATRDSCRCDPCSASSHVAVTLLQVLGDGYIDEETGSAGGFDSMWRGFMDRVVAETKVQERFTE